MTQPRPLVLVDLGQSARPQHPKALWGMSDFRERVQALGSPVYLWARRAAPDPWPTLRNSAALNAALAASGADHLIVIDAGQVFLDTAVARAGLATFDPSSVDSFTQWEHCRLPVGIGVRALATRTWHELRVDSPRRRSRR